MLTEKKHKIVITGTGRAGTTLLVELFTELGLDTGYTRATFRRDYHDHCKAGLERDIEDPQTPYIVKNPNLCELLPSVLAHGETVIDYAVIPIRQLDHAAKSRIRIGGNGRVPGGLRGTADPLCQKAVLAENFHHLVETLTAYDIPHAFLHFPRFVQDPRYTYAKLGPVLDGISYEHFERCFQRVAKPELVHTFLESQPTDAGVPAQAFRRSSWHKRLRRRVARAAGFLSCFALGFWAPWSPQKTSDAVKAPFAGQRVDIDGLKHSFSRTPRPSIAGNGSLRQSVGRRPLAGFRRFVPANFFRTAEGLIALRFPTANFFSTNAFRLDPDLSPEKAFLGPELFMR
jgi:hypothetical protein